MEVSMNDRRATAALFVLYFVVFMGAFFVLLSQFEFPDVLREAPAYRFTLFQASQQTIVVAYYAMVLTGVLQLFMAVGLFQVTERTGMVPLLALVSGIAAGVFQVLGFIRWVVLVLLLSSSLEAGAQSAETVFALEGLMNGYLGMGVGEHLGTLFLSLWLIFSFIAIKESRFIPEGVRIMMAAAALCLLLVAFEALGGPFAGIGTFSVALWGIFYTFIVVFVAALVQRGTEREKPRLHWGVWLGAWLFWAANVVPAFLG